MITRAKFNETFDERYSQVKDDCRMYFGKEHNECYGLLKEFYYWCEKYELKPTFSFGKVFVSSKYVDKWYFVPTGGKIALMHANRYFKNLGEYHKQFVKYISMRQLALYMSEHDRAKYTSEFVKFSVK